MRLFPRREAREPEADLPPLEEDEVLLVLEDLDNGQEYYLAFVDRFSVHGREYVALGAYEPDDGAHRAPEFVLMRFDTGPHGEHYYQSIRRRSELKLVFNVFFERYLRRL